MKKIYTCAAMSAKRSVTVADLQAGKGNNTLFLTAAIGLPNSPTESDILREAFRVLALGADAVMTARGMDIVSMPAKEDIPVMGHPGPVMAEGSARSSRSRSRWPPATVWM